MNKGLQKEAEAILKKHIDKESMDDVSENVWGDMIDAMIEYSQSQKQSEERSSDTDPFGFIRTTVIETSAAWLDWIENDVIIVDKDTNVEIKNAILDGVAPIDSLKKRVYEKLAKKGIKFTESPKP